MIFDPHIPLPPGGVPWFFTPVGFRIRLRQMSSNLKSGVAAARIRKALPDFKPVEAPDMAEEMFRTVHRSYETDNRHELQQHVTEQLLGHFKKGMRGNWALTNTGTVPLRLVGMANRPNVVQMRVLNVDKDNKDKTFAQLTIRVDAEYTDARLNDGLPPPSSTATAPTNRSTRRKGKKKSKTNRIVVPGQNTNVGEWMSALDENGKEYYWHTKTQERQWTKPSEFSSVVGTSEMNAKAGSSLTVEEEGQEVMVSLYRSEKYIVLERDLYLGEEGRWRICQL